jgi:hypothetical protein
VLAAPLFADGDSAPCGVTTTPLMAGQHYGAGEVRVWDDGTYLYVQFVTDDGWTLGETHVFAGTALPKKTAPGQFPYKGEGALYTIPLADLEVAPGGGMLYIAAHAVVSKGTEQQTAWGKGEDFGKNWAMYFDYQTCGAESLVPPSES